MSDAAADAAPTATASADAPTVGASADAAVRYRCTACGNLTRFDVTTTRRVRAYHHYTVGGELSVEDPEVLSESVDEVLCRWCGTGSTVVVLEPGDDAPTVDPDRADPSRIDSGS